MSLGTHRCESHLGGRRKDNRLQVFQLFPCGPRSFIFAHALHHCHRHHHHLCHGYFGCGDGMKEDMLWGAREEWERALVYLSLDSHGLDGTGLYWVDIIHGFWDLLWSWEASHQANALWGKHIRMSLTWVQCFTVQHGHEHYMDLSLERWLSVKSMSYSCRGPGFSSQHIYSNLQPSMTLVPRSLVPSSNLCRHCMYIWARHT